MEGDFCFMGNIKVADYLFNLTKYDDAVRDSENRIILDKYIERVHADGISCHRPYFSGDKEPKRPYSIYRLKTPYATYLAKERRNSSSPELKDNVEKTTKVHNEAIWGKVYNDCGVNSVEGYVAYKNMPQGRLFYSITQHLRSLTNVNREKLAFCSPNFFIHLTDMLENKSQYLEYMTPECFDELTNSLIASIISGETDMNGANTYLLKYAIGKKYTDVCRVGLEEHAYDDVVDKDGSLQNIKDDFNSLSQIYSNSFSSSNSRIILTPKRQIELIRRYAQEGLLSESNINLINKLANYDINACLSDRKENAGAVLTDSHADAIKFYLSQAENIL